MFWRKKPSTTETLLTLLLEDRRQSAALMEKVLAVTERQSGVMEKWLAFFENPPTPQVRVMTDFDEIAHERTREPLLHKEEMFTTIEFDPEQWQQDMNRFFGDLKSES